MILIDANELLKRICNEKCYHYHECRDDTDRCILYYYIKESPTAYDIDKVVEQLTQESIKTLGITETQFAMDKGEYSSYCSLSLYDAIKIVKGGVE